MKSSTAAGALAGALAMAVAGIAYATPGVTSDGVSLDAKTTTKKTGASTGLFTTIKGVPKDANGAEVPLRRVTLSFPATTKIDTNAVARCKASDQQIQQTNGKACPAGSKIGTGRAWANTGFGAPIDPIVENISVYNAAKGIIFFLTPGGAVGQTAVVRGRFSGPGTARVQGAAAGPKLVVDIPLFQIPGGGIATVTRLDIDVKPHGKGKKAYALAPKVCPKSRKWLLAATLEYDNHAPVKVTATGPCKK